ncbi:YfiR family protein [Methylomonas albis]|uniref:YfiR family protein n=1 Tax=Methylomonas albis TaxID=1854563 RepID=A0ABR9D6Q4_9GAMM|nr:YfiR family protein [Methylomonas albis]MBD9358801.1 YfiR family protein [Methylomonas albis]
MRLLKLLLLSVSVCFAGLARAEENHGLSREFQLKTAYLFHFAELAQWPSTAPVTICLQGHSVLRAYLPVLEGQQINGNAVHVNLDDAPDMTQCSILFLSDLAALTPVLTEQARQHHVLLVGDVENFANHGGMVQFTLRDNRLKLVVNLAAVKSADLKLSSKLLRMAEIIE